MQISAPGTTNRADSTSTTSTTSRSAGEDASLAEAFAALLAAPGALVAGPMPAWGAASGSGQGPTAFDGERQVAEEDARRQAPGRSAQAAALNQKAESSAAADRTETTEAAPSVASRTAALPAVEAEPEAAVKPKAETAAPPPTPLPAAPASARQLLLQQQATQAERSPKTVSPVAAEKLSTNAPVEMVKAAYVSQASASQGENGRGREGGTTPASPALEMNSASSNSRLPADAPAPTTSVAATASPLLERVSQIVSTLAQQPQQQVATRFDVGGGEQLGVVFRLRDQQLNVTFVTANRSLRQALQSGWEGVRAHGESLGLGIRDAAFTEPTPLS